MRSTSCTEKISSSYTDCVQQTYSICDCRRRQGNRNNGNLNIEKDLSNRKNETNIILNLKSKLKLSPNLRLKEKPPKKGQNIDQNMLQVQKLDKLLSLVRELPEDTEQAADSDSSDSDS